MIHGGRKIVGRVAGRDVVYGQLSSIESAGSGHAAGVQPTPSRNSSRISPLREGVLPPPHKLAATVEGERRGLPRPGPLLVAISGIDASGKGTLAAALTPLLRLRGLQVEAVGADAWLTPLEHLDLDSDPAGAFYRGAIRFEEMFRWIDELRARPLDVILMEGIFLFKRELRDRYDLSIWLECGFETALTRALERNQEGLPRERLIADYGRIYFPAQRLHLERDFPVDFAGILHSNDSQNT